MILIPVLTMTWPIEPQRRTFQNVMAHVKKADSFICLLAVALKWPKSCWAVKYSHLPCTLLSAFWLHLTGARRKMTGCPSYKKSACDLINAFAFKLWLYCDLWQNDGIVECSCCLERWISSAKVIGFIPKQNIYDTYSLNALWFALKFG